MPTTTIGGAPYPAGSDADNVPADLQALAEWASTRTVMRFADAAARDASITSPVAGMTAWLDTPGALTLRTATAWRTIWTDLAWTDIALDAAYEAYGTTPQAAVENGLFIVLKGGVQRSTSGAQIAGDSILGSIPSSLGTPLSGDYPIATQWSTDNVGRLYVGSTRNLQYVGSSTNWVSLNGIRIPLA
ncbi:hypothetical protein [Streptomyces sp. bgisy154]|uniref:hypothetical protein n=1 Tax=Streptomyces sp. bgisy154 TaxID=3413794 RepID=UPI003D730CC2